jgi:hypothetical protein
MQIACDVAYVRDGEEIVDVRPASGRVDRREAHPDDRQRARRAQGSRPLPDRVEPVPDRRDHACGVVDMARRAAERRNPREILGERIDRQRLRAHTQAGKIA